MHRALNCFFFSPKRFVQGQLENHFGGYQEYTKAIASTVAKVEHIRIILREIAYTVVIRFLPTFRTMRPLLCLLASQRRSSLCTIEALLDLDWFHL